MKRSYEVTLNGVKHEIDPKTKDTFTTLHLELPGEADLRFLHQVFLRFKEPRQGQSGHFRLHIEDLDGDKRTFDLTSEGTKTKDFMLLAVVKKNFNPHDGFEQFFGRMYFEGDPRPVLLFEAELFQPDALIEAVDTLTQSVKGSDVTVTLEYGDKSVTLGKKDRNLDA
ncbi:hypothetical protein [Deinococcus ruber]|uniref:Uncharacterized protein n=1 Tax=Deinococcus ruber TaxID=1848197 RepID=A0A918CCZ7_9DEIO|nr:hypothetical protein [Deinococcus ruber]GGR16496.1 hypothetical protein GCM10008957_31430 [Deinococcus ruber]